MSSVLLSFAALAIAIATRSERCDDHVDLIALDELVDVIGRLGGVRLVVHLEVLELATAELASLFADIEPEAIFDRRPECRKGPV